MTNRSQLFRKSILFLVSAFWLLYPITTASTANDSDPLPVVKKTVDRILQILEDPRYAGKDKKAEREELILSVVKDRFDFHEMSERTLASNWNRISAQQQETFTDLFSKLLQNTYVKKIEQYSGEKIIYGEHEVRGRKAVVESKIIRSGIETPLVYRLKNDSGSWRVYDVLIEGVSLVSNYRSQFADIIEREKFSGLLERMKEKIAGQEG
jgi:phospholipid transport system substrate-binding protein